MERNRCTRPAERVGAIVEGRKASKVQLNVNVAVVH